MASPARRAEPINEPPERVVRGVQILARILYFIFWVVILTWLVRGAFGWLFGRRRKGESRPASANRPAGARQLHRDPVCGTHVAEDIAQRLEWCGQTLHFCSAQCRERFLESQRQRVSA